MRVLKAAEGEILDLAFSPDGRAVAAIVRYHGVFLWNLDAGTPSPVRLTDEDDPRLSGVEFSADGRSLSWLGGGSRWVYDRDIRETTEQAFAVTQRTLKLAHSADASRVISQHGMPDHFLIGWRRVDDEWIQSWVLSTADMAVESITLTAEGRRFAMLARSALGNQWSSNPRRVEVRDAANSAIRCIGEYPYTYAEPLLFSPDGQQLAGFNDMTLLIWVIPDTGSLGPPHLIRNDTRKQFTALAYHPLGQHLYAASNDETVHVFDTTTWERVKRFTWQLGKLKAVTVSPDGMLAAAGGDKGDVVIWDVDV